jgi:hypothetical protein
VIVRDVAKPRVSATEAKKLYEETASSIAERERQADVRQLAGPSFIGRRPIKRDRRRYDAGQD